MPEFFSDVERSNPRDCSGTRTAVDKLGNQGMPVIMRRPFTPVSVFTFCHEVFGVTRGRAGAFGRCFPKVGRTDWRLASFCFVPCLPWAPECELKTENAQAASVARTKAGNCRREILDHIIALNEEHLRRLISDYVRYHQEDRIHDSLYKDTPNRRPIEPKPAGDATVALLPRLGSLHHRYAWRRIEGRLDRGSRRARRSASSLPVRAVRATAANVPPGSRAAVPNIGCNWCSPGGHATNPDTVGIAIAVGSILCRCGSGCGYGQGGKPACLHPVERKNINLLFNPGGSTIGPDSGPSCTGDLAPSGSSRIQRSVSVPPARPKGPAV